MNKQFNNLTNKAIVHNLTLRGIEKVKGVLDFDQRGIIYAEKEDIVVTRRPPEKSFLAYLNELGWNFSQVKFVSPRNYKKYRYNSIFHDHLIKKIISRQKKYYLDSYQVTEEEEKFSQTTKIPLFANTSLSFKYGTKSGFRKIFHKLKLNIAFGYENLKNRKEVKKAIEEIFNKGSHALMVKMDEGISGAGNTKIEKEEYLSKSDKQKDELVAEATSKVPQKKTHGFVVEKWVEDVLASPSVQLVIYPSGKIEILSLHDQLLEGKEQWYVGCVYPVHSVNLSIIRKLKKQALIFAKYLAKKGYYGYFGLDTVLTKKGEIYWVEANMRKPGTFYPRVIAEKLNSGTLEGINYFASDFTVKKFLGANFSSVRDFLKDYLYNRKKKHGLVLYNVGALKEAGRFDGVILGKNYLQTQKIYEEIKNKLRRLDG